MLARTFKTAQELRISEDEHRALREVMRMFEEGEVTYFQRALDRPFVYQVQGHNHFNMAVSCMRNYFDVNGKVHSHPCGTVRCIGGWVGAVLGLEHPDDYVSDQQYGSSLTALYWNPLAIKGDATVEQAAKAICNFLTTGDPDWDNILAPAA